MHFKKRLMYCQKLCLVSRARLFTALLDRHELGSWIQFFVSNSAWFPTLLVQTFASFCNNSGWFPVCVFGFYSLKCTWLCFVCWELSLVSNFIILNIWFDLTNSAWFLESVNLLRCLIAWKRVLEFVFSQKLCLVINFIDLNVCFVTHELCMVSILL